MRAASASSWFAIAVPEDGRDLGALAVFERAIDGSPTAIRPSVRTRSITRAGERAGSRGAARRPTPRAARDGGRRRGHHRAPRRAGAGRATSPTTTRSPACANRPSSRSTWRSRSRAPARRRAVALLYIDLDDFKLVNDTLGHAAGDELLRQAPSGSPAARRATDLLARHGGDEFMLLLDDLDGDARATARLVADDLVATLRSRSLFEVTSSYDRAPASASRSSPATARTSPPTCSRRADAAMYDAKRRTGAGRAASTAPGSTGPRRR